METRNKSKLPLPKINILVVLLATILIVVAIFVVLYALAIVPLAYQHYISVGCLVAGIVLAFFRNNKKVCKLLLLLSGLSALRYLAWRIAYTLNLSDPIHAIACISLLLAEIFTVFFTVLSYFQMWEVDRSLADTPTDENYEPTVDVFICTYNEPLDILRRTVTTSLLIDYKNKKVFVLDDGRRQEVKDLCDELGCNYITRDTNLHAKAGNINNALRQTEGEFVAFLDADHVPVESFLKRTTVFFKDPKVALVQTPYRHLNPSPIERNLKLQGRLPHEQEMFFQIVQVGQNHWNAAFFCGTSAICRRSALDEVNGVATETVTEDCHTSLRLHALGYRSIYLPVSLVAGLSPETLADFIAQRCRWARGSVQIFHYDNPFTLKGLTIPQRICYGNTVFHFFYGLPRIVFILAPLSYLLFNILPLRAVPTEYLFMATPYVVLCLIAANYQFKNYRHSFWSDVYETTVSPFLVKVTTETLFDPKKGKFDVTPKGNIITQSYFDKKFGSPLVLFFIISLAGLVILPFRLLNHLTPLQQQAIFINEFWNFYNLIVASTAVFVAFEGAQRRRTHRLNRALPITVNWADAPVFPAFTQDMTEYGTSVICEELPVGLEKGQVVTMHLPHLSDASQHFEVVGTVRQIQENNKSEKILGIEFGAMEREHISKLFQVAYCDSDTWTTFTEPRDGLLSSLGDMAGTPFRMFASNTSGQPAPKIEKISEQAQTISTNEKAPDENNTK